MPTAVHAYGSICLDTDEASSEACASAAAELHRLYPPGTRAAIRMRVARKSTLVAGATIRDVREAPPNAVDIVFLESAPVYIYHKRTHTWHFVRHALSVRIPITTATNRTPAARMIVHVAC